MKFKLNGFEKFIIRHNKLICIIAIIAVIISVTLSIKFEDYSLFTSLTMLIYWLVFLFTLRIPLDKVNQITKLCNEQCDMYACIDACNQMIEAYNPKSITQLSNLCLNRIVCLINIGDYDRAEKELNLFWQSFNLKKLNGLDLASTHILMANIALGKENPTLFNEQMALVREYSNNSTIVGPLRRNYEHNVASISLMAEAMNANESSNAYDFEMRVLALLNTNPMTGKPRKKPAERLFYFSANNKLFEFYKNSGNKEKATYHAYQLLNLGNEQFEDYRRAKEYLENANRSN